MNNCDDFDNDRRRRRRNNFELIHRSSYSFDDDARSMKKLISFFRSFERFIDSSEMLLFRFFSSHAEKNIRVLTSVFFQLDIHLLDRWRDRDRYHQSTTNKTKRKRQIALRRRWILCLLSLYFPGGIKREATTIGQTQYMCDDISILSMSFFSIDSISHLTHFLLLLLSGKRRIFIWIILKRFEFSSYWNFFLDQRTCKFNKI